jgi:hypothetical protein
MAFLKSCGYCCGLFSLFAIVFLLCVGAILKSGSDVINIQQDQKAAAGSNCYVAAAIYGGFVVLSGICIAVSGTQTKNDELNRLVQVQRSQV